MAQYSVYVTKLPLSITKRQLITLFSPTAPVADAYVCVNASHIEYTYGFVRFVKLEDANKAISEWDGAMYKDQRLLVEMSRHDTHTASSPQGGGRAWGGRRLDGRVADKGNWQDLRQTWAMMKAGDQTSIHWNTLVKELTQISYSLIPPFFVDDDKESWSYSGGEPFKDDDSVTRLAKCDGDVRKQDHCRSDDTSTGHQILGHQGSESHAPHVEPPGNKPPVKLVSIGRGKMLSLQ